MIILVQFSWQASEVEKEAPLLLFLTFLNIKHATAVSSWLKSANGVKNGNEKFMF